MLNKKQTHLFISFFIALSFALFFVFWTPHPKDDLFRYFAWLDIMRVGDFWQTLKFILGRGEIVSMSYFFIIAKSGVYGLLQFFPTLISLIVIQYVAIDYVFRNNRPIWLAWAGIGFFFGCFEIFLIASGVRSTLAFSVFILALYKDLILGKSNKWLYIITPFIHLGAIVPLAIRFILKIKSTSFYCSLALILLFLFIYPGGQFIGLFVSESPKDIVSVNLYKLAFYLTPYFPLSLPYLYKISKLVFIFYITFYLYKNKNDYYLKFFVLLSVVSFLSLGNYIFWYRLLEIAIIGSPIIIIQLLDSMKYVRFKATTVFALVVIILVGVRVQMAYYKLDEFNWNIKNIPKNNQGWKLN